MRRNPSCAVLAVGILCALGATPGRGAEDWADPNLKVTDGLEVWLDGARQNSARLALKQPGKNDYVSGLTIDQAWLGTTRFESLNVEGAGFGGAVNLLGEAADFGTVQRLCVTSEVGRGGTRLYVNGKPAGRRDRAD